jgi:8-oxo-dGTP pyrophosphatase MutT (NUDIX family)
VTPHPAATVVLLRGGSLAPEVLLIHRPGTMVFGPGLHAFPGGKVDPEDLEDRPGRDGRMSAAEAANRLGGILPERDALALHHAAVREVAEEVGVSLRPRDLAPIALWTTPRFMPRRFATWFFVADLPPDAVPVFEPEEVAAHRWLTAHDALEARADGEIEMWVPTTSVLERLLELHIGSAADVRARVEIERPAPASIIERTETATTVEVHAAGGLPGRRGRVEVIGRRDVVVVDPGDPTEEALDVIRGVVAEADGTIRAVVLTAVDPDHAGGAEALAFPLGVPVLVAPGAGRRLPHDTVEVADGHPLPTDADAAVRLGPPGSNALDIVRQ